MSEPRVFTYIEAASELGVPIGQLSGLVRSGKLEYATLKGDRGVYISRESVLAYQKELLGVALASAPSASEAQVAVLEVATTWRNTQRAMAEFLRALAIAGPLAEKALEEAQAAMDGLPNLEGVDLDAPEEEA